MKKLKRNEISKWLRDKPYLYTPVGVIVIMASPLIFITYSIQCLREESFFSEFVHWYCKVSKLILMQV